MCALVGLFKKLAQLTNVSMCNVFTSPRLEFPQKYGVLYPRPIQSLSVYWKLLLQFVQYILLHLKLISNQNSVALFNTDELSTLDLIPKAARALFLILAGLFQDETPLVLGDMLLTQPIFQWQRHISDMVESFRRSSLDLAAHEPYSLASGS